MNVWSRFTSWFSPQEEKSNPNFAGMTAFSGLPQPIASPRSFQTYATEGYKDPTVYKCVSYIARNGAAIPPILYTDATKKKTIDKHPLLDKLNNPNSEQSGVAYREAVIGFKLLAGNAFQYAIRAKNGPPDELWSLRPDRIKIVPSSKTRTIIGYQYDPLGPDAPISAADIGHTKYWNPNDDLYGLSPMETAAIMVDQQTAARKWNLALLQNQARPSGFWTTPAIMGGPERAKLEEKLQQKFSGPRNAGKFSVLDAGLDWKSMGLAPAQMDYLDMLKFNGGSIASIYNLDPQLVGDTSASTYNNMDASKVASYTEAIFPDLDDLYALWNNWLVPMYPDLKNSGAYLYYDKETVEVIQQMIQAQKDAIVKRATQLWMSGGCDLYTYQTMAGIDPDKNAKGIYRYGAVLVLSSDLQKYAEQSLQKPAAPPMPVPEPELNMPTPGTPTNGNTAPTQPQDTNTPPTPTAKPTTPTKPKTPAVTQDQEGNTNNGQKSQSRLLDAPYVLSDVQTETSRTQGELGARQRGHMEDTSASSMASREIPGGNGRGPQGVLQRVLQDTSETQSLKKSSKKVDLNGLYQPDDLYEQLAALEAQGVTATTWHVDTRGGGCDICIENDGVTVPLGEQFPSGHILPKAHNHCECFVTIAAQSMPHPQKRARTVYNFSVYRQQKLAATNDTLQTQQNSVNLYGQDDDKTDSSKSTKRKVAEEYRAFKNRRHA